MLDVRLSYALRPNAQAFDEIRIITIPRYKQSGLSGDEWRISTETRFYRKGKIVHTVTHGNTETAAGFLYADYISAMENGHAFFGGDGLTCDQEGCENRATVKYRLRQLFSREGYHSIPSQPTYRCFCDEHKKRGDCGLEDADDNYELVS